MAGHDLAANLSRTRNEAPAAIDGESIFPDRSLMVLPVDVAGTETNDLPDPEKAGIELTIVCNTRSSGTRTITAATAFNQAGNDTIALDAAGEWVTLRSIPVSDGYRWSVLASDGATLS